METQIAKEPIGTAPASSPAGRYSPKPALRPSPVKPPVILVVDDNKDYRELVKHLLTVNRYKVLEAGNGEEALVVINKSAPDLVLVDFNMPKMNGYELIQEIRSNFDTRKMRIIMFTGAANRQHLKTLNMDISDFLEKPVPNARLLESVARTLGAGKQPVPEGKASVPPAAPARPAVTEAPPEIEPPPGGLQFERFEPPAPPEPSAAPGPLSAAAGHAPERRHIEIRIPAEDTVSGAPGVPAPQPKAAPAAAVPAELPALRQEEPPAGIYVEPQAQSEGAPEAAPAGEAEPPVEAVPEISMVDMEGLLSEDEHDLEVIESGAERKEEAQDARGLENLTNDSPLIQRVNKILMAAVEMRASDIHIEPNEARVVVRVRIDGILKQLTTLPISIHPRLTARIKIMSSLVITERRMPQDGQFRVQIKGQKIEFRVSTLPCIKGEKIVLRILGQSKLNTSLSQLDMSPRELQSVEKALKSPNGLVLVTGPTGSGKTTTLYTMINVLNRPEVNIMTAEDPVEYEVPHVNQVKIRPVVGLTFESTLRAFLRQDPDIMLVGEIRDVETAEIAIKASITGHLVFSTLHTNSAPATVVRLTHMGVAPYLVAASVKLVMAQRLLRTLCPYCKKPGLLANEDKKFLTPEEISRFKNVYTPGSCQRCNQGYSGRKAVFEVMPVESSAMRQLITASNDADLLTALAVKEGMTTLRQSALNAVRQGYTSMYEALKVMMG